MLLRAAITTTAQTIKGNTFSDISLSVY
jgi:hypothetical protein